MGKRTFAKWGLSWPLLILPLAYAPALIYSFAHHDQYRYFRVHSDEKISCSEDAQFYGLLYDLGRPVTALLDCLQFKTVNGIADLTWHRLITLLLIVGLAYLLSRVFCRRWNFQATSGALLAAVICVLPGLLNLFVMTNQSVVVALILATAAFLAFDLRPRNLVATFILFTVALFTYPAAAFLLLALVFGNFLFTKDAPKTAYKRLIAANLLGVAACLIYFATVKFLLHSISNYDLRYPDGVGWGGSTYAFSLSADPEKRLRFLGNSIGVVFNFWNIYTSLFIGLPVVAFLIFLAVRRSTWKLPVAVIGFFATLSPLLFSHIEEILFRTLISISVYALLVLVWLYKENFKINSAAKWALAISAVCLSSFNLFMTARNSALEMAFLKGQIQERGLRDHKILLIKNVYRNQASLGINGLPSVTDEFNVNSTTYYEHEVIWILRIALIEAGADPKVQVVACADGEDCAKAEIALKANPNVYVISRGADFSAYPARFPVIDMEQFSR